MNWQHSRALVGLAAAQLHRIGRVGFALPLIAGALIAVVGVVLSAAVDAQWTTAVVIMLMPLHSLVVGLASVGVLAGDPLVELRIHARRRARRADDARGPARPCWDGGRVRHVRAASSAGRRVR